MKKPAAFITRHKRLLLFAMMLVTLAVSSFANQQRLEGGAAVTSLPVMQTTPSAEPVMAYLDDRAAAYRRDIDALTALIQQEELDSRTREDAAAQLQALIEAHTASSALEEALASSALAPCAAVLSGGSLTLVTACTSVSEADTALVLTLAAAHAGVAPENVRIRTAE